MSAPDAANALPIAPWLASLIDPSSCLPRALNFFAPDMPPEPICKIVAAIARGAQTQRDIAKAFPCSSSHITFLMREAALKPLVRQVSAPRDGIYAVKSRLFYELTDQGEQLAKRL